VTFRTLRPIFVLQKVGLATKFVSGADLLCSPLEGRKISGYLVERFGVKPE
jgi:hypothetical protein